MMLSTISNKKVKSKKQESIATVCAVAFWLLVWHFVSVAVGSDIILVSPLRVVETLLSVLRDPDFLSTVSYSFIRIIGGFFAAMLLGVLLGWLSSRLWIIETLLRPITVVIKATPVASFIILVLLWFSSKNLSVIISMLMVFPVIYLNTLEGIKNWQYSLLCDTC